MTIKELANFTARTERTVRRWINKAELTSDTLTAKMSDAMKTNTPSDYTLDETEQILRCSSLPKIVVDDLMFNARKPTQIEASSINPPNNQMEEMAKMISIAVTSALVPIVQQLTASMNNNFSNVDTKQLSLPGAPEIEPRAYLNQLVREYAHLKKTDFQTSWNMLYSEMLYRCKTNVKVKAKNEGIKPIDYLERENMLLTACSIMKSLTK